MWRALLLAGWLTVPGPLVCAPWQYTETVLLPDGRVIVCTVVVLSNCSTTRYCSG